MTATAPHVELLAALVCDDVRREDNGKEILIGVYTGAIVVPKLPASLPLSLWLHLQTRGSGEMKLEFRVIGPAAKELAHGEAMVGFAESDQPASLALPKLPLVLDAEGMLEFQWRQNGADWSTLARKKVKLPASAA